MSPLPDNAQRVRAGVYRADGYLWIRAYVTCPDGKRRMVGPRLAEQQGVGAEFEALAEVELAKRKAAMREGRVLAARKREPTVAEFVEQLDRGRPVSVGSARTRASQRAKWLPALGDLRLSAVTSEDVAPIWTEVLAADPAPAYAAKILSSMRGIFAAAVDAGLIAHNPVVAAGIRPPSQTRQVGERFGGAAIAAVVAREADDMHALAYLFGWGLGMRVGEVAKLRASDFSTGIDGGMQLRINHKNVIRLVPVPAQLWAIARTVWPLLGTDAGDPHAHLMTTPWTRRGNHVAPSRISGWWSKLAAKHGVDSRFHDLRREWIATASALGVRETVRNALTGHTPRGVEAVHYDGTMPGETREAVEMVWAYISEAMTARSVVPAVVLRATDTRANS